jgi:hypothetical protein
MASRVLLAGLLLCASRCVKVKVLLPGNTIQFFLILCFPKRGSQNMLKFRTKEKLELLCLFVCLYLYVVSKFLRSLRFAFRVPQKEQSRLSCDGSGLWGVVKELLGREFVSSAFEIDMPTMRG